MSAKTAETVETTFESADTERIEVHLSGLCSPTRIRAAGTPTRARIVSRVISPQLEFHDLSFSFDLSFDAAPPQWLVLCDVVSRTVHRGPAGADDPPGFGPGEQFLLARPGARYCGSILAARLRYTLLAPAALATVADAADGAAQIEVTSHRPVSRKAQAKLQRALAHVRDDVTADPASTGAPLLVSAAVHYLAAMVLHTYPNTAILDLSARERRDASPPAVARAAAFMDSNPDQALTLADIAAAAHVSPRALQLGFRRHLDTTPMSYLRRIRLDHAHAQLLAARDEGLTVATVAARWGFALSGFSEQYRSAHRELPSETLRR